MHRIAVAVTVLTLSIVGLAPPASAGAPRPDLTAGAVADPPVRVRANRVFDVSYTAANIGEGGAGPTETTAYLSKNTTKGASDIILGIDEVSPIDPASSSPESTPMVVPADTPAGKYYLILCVNDVAPRVREVTRANNCAASAATTRIFAAGVGAFSGSTDFEFGDGCDFVHQSFEGIFNAFGPYTPGTFVTDGCVGSADGGFTFSGPFTITTPETVLTGTAVGTIGGGDDPPIDLLLLADNGIDKIRMTGRWTNSGEIPARNDPIDGVMTVEP